MVVSSLQIDNFRNLRKLSLPCSAGINLVIGENASGKTSLLEALYFLGRARSFRTNQIRELIHISEASFRIVASMIEDQRRIPVGIERSIQDLSARIDGVPARSLAELASHMPVLLLNLNSHQLLEGGPQQRRRFMDWGLFHIEQEFLDTWRDYGTALRHRNAALRTHSTNRSIDAWDRELVRAAETLDRLRRTFCRSLESTLSPLTTMMLGDMSLTMEYHRGWPQNQKLMESLRSGREQDCKYGFTRPGPHRADFVLRINGRTVSESLSRGQQKLLIIALVLAQARLYQLHQGRPCILLIDDLPAELDHRHRAKAMACLAEVDAQLFITAIEAESLDIRAWSSQQVLKLDRGRVVDTCTS